MDSIRETYAKVDKTLLKTMLKKKNVLLSCARARARRFLPGQGALYEAWQIDRACQKKKK